MGSSTPFCCVSITKTRSLYLRRIDQANRTLDWASSGASRPQCFASYAARASGSQHKEAAEGRESLSTTLGTRARHRFWNELSGSLPGSMPLGAGGLRRAGATGPMADLPTAATASPAALAFPGAVVLPLRSPAAAQVIEGQHPSRPVSPSAVCSPNGAHGAAHRA